MLTSQGLNIENRKLIKYLSSVLKTLMEWNSTWDNNNYYFEIMNMWKSRSVVVVESVRYKPVKGWLWNFEYIKIIYVNWGTNSMTCSQLAC